ncbi:hypothetical protein PybrP1_005281 [[Pythium] brassicae (nom. inval.)]|nr:hypothetical protein PybrP1_005281 [[Pythium] brassicae (nom. inval.)]
MSVGIVHIDFRGFAYVPGDGASAAFARLRASYSMLGAHGLIAERTFGSGYTDDVYEGMDFNPVVWTPCAATAANRTATNATVVGGSNRTNTSALPSLAPGRATGLESYWIRIESRIVAQKARLVDEDVQIAIDSSDAMLAKGHLEYAMVARPCA